MDSLFLLTQNSGKILGPIAKVLGYLMNAIYVFMDKFLNIQNVGLTIIVFTIVIYFCLLPLTYKQQKFSKMLTALTAPADRISPHEAVGWWRAAADRGPCRR